MKLRTRIIGISCITVLAATMFSELFIWVYTGKNLKNEAVLKGLQECYALSDQIAQDIADKTDADLDKIYLEYLFKTYNDNYNICYLEYNSNDNTEIEAEEVYNNTVFSHQQLSELEYNAYEETVNDIPTFGNNQKNIDVGYINYEGRKYVVYSRMMNAFIHIYRIEDITYVQDKVVNMAIVMAGITILVMTAAILILLFVLKIEFRFLQQLSDTAESMAEGFYDQRIDIRKRDEIGQLAENFNKMAQAVEMRTNSLEESEQRKTIFMGNLTHELKTPMTAISGYAQTLLTAKISEEDQREALQYIYEECGRLERLSRKMMNLLELNQSSELQFKNTPVKTLFEMSAKSCKVILENKQINLQCIEHGEYFNMDIDLMTDVIINLIDNAVKASEPGSQVILCAQDNRIQVQDFGKGIPKEEQGKILEPFYMIDKSRSRKNGGAGLGLALIAVIVQKHNIKLSIDSEPGKGSRFVLEF
ncbi:MAG: sensor histidine kinase [Eubacterium sp.]